MKIAYFSITGRGRQLAELLNERMPGTLFGKDDLKETMRRAFREYDALVCIMAAGIAVRILAPLLVHKDRDPAVVVMDSKGEFAVSLLSGHLGGANALAAKMADISGGQAVITTATDVEGAFAFDLFAKKHGMRIENIDQLKYISTALLEGEPVQLLDHNQYDGLPEEGLLPYDEECPYPVVAVSDRGFVLPQQHVLYLRPASLWVGIGCKAGVSGADMIRAVETALVRYGLSELSLCGIATIPRKAEEPAVRETAAHWGLDVTIVSEEEIRGLDFETLGIRRSDFVSKTVGVPSVATASAYIASGGGEILADKETFPGITVSLVRQSKSK